MCQYENNTAATACEECDQPAYCVSCKDSYRLDWDSCNEYDSNGCEDDPNGNQWMLRFWMEEGGDQEMCVSDCPEWSRKEEHNRECHKVWDFCNI